MLEVNPESNSFEFILEADGLTLYTEDGIYYLVSTDNKDCRIRFDQIFIYDANGRFTAGKTDIVDAGNGRYTLTVTAPREFLDDAETTYPVTIDPTINISTNTPWYSDAGKIGHWRYSPSLWFSNLCTESSLPLLDGFTNGQYIWNEALNISVSLESSSSSADIKFYGGTKSQIDALALFDPVATTSYGYTCYYDITYETKIPSNTGEKNLFVLNEISGYIVKRDDLIYYNYIKTIAHEMGHALGWFGHPAVSHDDWIMEQGRYTTSTLSDEERQHLKRAY